MSRVTFKVQNLAIIFLALTSADAVAANQIISNNTIWRTGEVHNLSQSTVQIADGATLTIERGVEVIGPGSIQTFGVLNVAGGAGSLVHFKDVDISYNNPDYSSIDKGRVNVAYAHIEGGSILAADGSARYGTFTLTDSIVTNLAAYMYLWYPTSDVRIERNIFYKSEGISVGHSDNVSVYIKNNAFAEQIAPYFATAPYAVENWASYSGATVVENNSFLSTDKVALLLPSGYTSAAILALNNYFGTTDTALIDAMIFDKKDDLSVASVISTSHTNAPSPGTPRLFVGTDGNDTLVGGGTGNGLLIGASGVDAVMYSKAHDQYKISLNDSHIKISDTADSARVDLLMDVERLWFSDKSIAFDIAGGNAGTVAKVLGAVFGKNGVGNTEYAGMYLELLDEGMSYENLMMLALNMKLGTGFSDADEINLLYQNLVGSQPSQADLDYWTRAIASGQYTQAALGVMAADLALNASNINLAGLANTGLSFHTSATSKNDAILGTAGSDILTAGAGGNDTIDGLSGVDTVIYSDAYAQYTISLNTSIATVNDKSGNTGTDTLKNVERLQFSDLSLALDIDGNAGTVAKILGAVFGKEAVGNAKYAGIGLRLLDDGMSYEELMMLALNAKLDTGFSNADEVRLLYQNLVGSQPSQADLDYWTGAIASGQYTQAALGVMAANLELNIRNINLAGLANTGLAYHN